MAKDRYGSPWLTVGEAAAYARCGECAIKSLIETGALPSYKPINAVDVRRRLIYKGDIDAVIHDRMIKTRIGSLICGGFVRPDVVLDLEAEERAHELA